MRDVGPLIKTRIGVGFALVTLLVLAIGVSAYRSATHFEESAGREMLLYEVEARLDKLISQLTDVETGVRSYLITGDEQYLRPYRTAAAAIGSSIEALRAMARDSPQQERRLDSLALLVAQEVSLSQQAVEARSMAGLEAAAEVVRRLKDGAIMDATWRTIREIKAEHWQAMRQYEADEHGSGHDTMRSFGFLTVVAILLLVTIAYLFQRDVTNRQQAQQVLQTAYRELDHRVEERTAELARSNMLLRQEITDHQRAEAALREMQKVAQQRERLADVGAIAAQIVHDLGNPLAGVSMQAQLILRRAKHDANQPVSIAVPPLEHILTEVHHLDSLIKGFMEFAREQRLDLKAVDLPRFLQELVDLWQPVAAARGIALSLASPDDGLSLTADHEKLRRVLDNLIKNAIEAIDHGPGRVGIHVTPTADTVRISVTDTGPGIADTVQAFRLFETTKQDGSGLGLAVVKQIVLAHCGRVEFARLAPHGTVFHIDLPRTLRPSA